MPKRKPLALPPNVINESEPCKNGQPYVAADGSCLRCGADQGEACRERARTTEAESVPARPTIDERRRWQVLA